MLGVLGEATPDGVEVDLLDVLHVPVQDGRFAGVKRRSELLGEPGGIAIIDDFAHHPTEVAATLEGLRARFAGRRLVAIFEPRSLTASQNIFYDEYRRAFLGADEVLLAPVFHANRFPPDECLDIAGIAAELRASGVSATVTQSIDELAETVSGRIHPGDVVVTMSPGNFEGLPGRLVATLEQRFRQEATTAAKRA